MEEAVEVVVVEDVESKEPDIRCVDNFKNFTVENKRNEQKNLAAVPAAQ